MNRLLCSIFFATLWQGSWLAAPSTAADLVGRADSGVDSRATVAEQRSAGVVSLDLIGNAGSALTKLAVPRRSFEPSADALLRLIEGAQVQVAAGALDQLVRKAIDEDVPVRDELLGVPLSGRARLRGATSLQLVRDPERGVFDIFLSGEAVSQTVGDAGKAHIHSRTITRFIARKRIILDANGLVALPAACNATARSTLARATSPLPGVRGRLASRIGWRRAQDQLSEADRISAQHSAAEIRRRFDAEVAIQLAEANQLLKRQTAAWTSGYGGRLPLRFSTTGEHLCVSGAKAEPLHASAPTSFAGGSENVAAVIMIPAAAVDLPTMASVITAIAGNPGDRGVAAVAQQVLPPEVAELLEEQNVLGNSDYGVRFAVERGRLVLAVHERGE
jgi:hypothetical protein